MLVRIIWLFGLIPLLDEKNAALIPMELGIHKRINLSLINNFVIPLPPFNEQKRIVAKVRQLLILCDELEQRVMENQKNSEFLMEAVLKETFSS